MKIGFIGAGNMGSALARAASGHASIYVYDIDRKKASMLSEEINAKVSDIQEISRVCDYVFLAVKPKFVSEVIGCIKACDALSESITLVSMAAGIALESLDKMAEGRFPIIRIMPNTPVAVGRGVVLTARNALVSDAVFEDFEGAMQDAGDIVPISEELIDAGTALSGCSPAFVYMFIDALAEGAVEAGLQRDDALRFAAKTLIGASSLLLESKKDPSELRDAVCSPGGSTIEGVRSLMNDGFTDTVKAAVIASYKRTVELGK